jgi:hypothetical protein
MTTAALASPPRYVLGLDLGQAQDYTALVVAQPSDANPPTIDVGHVERLPLGTRYPAVVEHVGAVVNALRRPTHGHDWVGRARKERRPVSPDVTLVCDYTGVGRPVFDMLVDAGLDCDLVGVTITAGQTVQRIEELGRTVGMHVPKRVLASAVQVVLHEGRLRIAHGLPQAGILTGELANFRAKIGASGHDSYGAGDDWREGNHDDLVLALALASWWAESRAAVWVG